MNCVFLGFFIFIKRSYVLIEWGLMMVEKIIKNYILWLGFNFEINKIFIKLSIVIGYMFNK